MSIGQSDGSNPLVEVPSSQVALVCVKLTKLVSIPVYEYFN